MSALIHDFPDPCGFALSRRCIHHAQDVEIVTLACDVLAASNDWTDIHLVREARNALNALPGAELSGTAAGIFERIGGPRVLVMPDAALPEEMPDASGLGRMVVHFEALKPVRVKRAPLSNAQLTARVIGIAAAALALVCAINIAMAAPGKIARTEAVFHQIEEIGRE